MKIIIIWLLALDETHVSGCLRVELQYYNIFVWVVKKQQTAVHESWFKDLKDD